MGWGVQTSGLIERSGMSDETEIRARMQKAIDECNERNYKKAQSELPAPAGSPAIIPVRLGEHPVRYHNWKSQFDGWTAREEAVAHAAYMAGWYHRCNQDPDAYPENQAMEQPHKVK